MTSGNPETAGRDRLLWVTADAGAPELLVRALREVCEVEMAAGLEAARVVLRTRRPDAVLARVAEGGLELLPELAGDSPPRDVPILLLGGPADEARCLDALAAGAGDFLLEPFSPRALAARVAACLRASRARREAAARERDLVAECQMATEALERVQRRFQAFLNNSPVAAWITDEQGQMLFVSEPYTRIFGIPAEAALGCSVFDLFPAPHAQELYDHLRAVAETGGTLEAVEPVPRPDGSQGWFLVYQFPIRDESGGLLVGAVAVDVTEMRRAEAELERAHQQAQAANDAKDRFLATLSHELRAPLTPVLAVISTLESAADLAGHAGELAMIRRNVELEARLIDDLLDLTRVSAGKLELHRRATDARKIVEHVVTTMEPEIAEKGLRLTVQLAAEEHRVWADAPRLTQVFWNLLSNAAKFTPPAGAIAVASRLESTLAGARELVLDVRDTGIGIEPDVLPRIFDAFEQTDRRITRKFGGLGLGLAVSRAIVELHGGRLTAASEGSGKGATFTVRLPLGGLQDELDETGVWFSRPRQTGDATVPHPERPLRVLLVEDHVDTAHAVAGLLRLSGHQVDVAATVAEALAAAARAGNGAPFDLVLSDLGLPDGSGQDLMRELAARYGLKGIALSGYGMEEDVRRSHEAGFACHLTKPVNRQALEATIRQVVGSGGDPTCRTGSIAQ